MFGFAIMNIIISTMAILWLTMYMHNFIKDVENWYNEIGHELFTLCIVPIINTFMLVIIIIRYWQALKGNTNPRYN